MLQNYIWETSRKEVESVTGAKGHTFPHTHWRTARAWGKGNEIRPGIGPTSQRRASCLGVVLAFHQHEALHSSHPSRGHRHRARLGSIFGLCRTAMERDRRIWNLTRHWKWCTEPNSSGKLLQCVITHTTTSCIAETALLREIEHENRGYQLMLICRCARKVPSKVPGCQVAQAANDSERFGGRANLSQTCSCFWSGASEIKGIGNGQIGCAQASGMQAEPAGSGIRGCSTFVSVQRTRSSSHRSHRSVLVLSQHKSSSGTSAPPAVRRVGAGRH